MGDPVKKAGEPQIIRQDGLSTRTYNFEDMVLTGHVFTPSELDTFQRLNPDELLKSTRLPTPAGEEGRPEPTNPAAYSAYIIKRKKPKDVALYISIDSSGSMEKYTLLILAQIMQIERALASEGPINLTLYLSTFEDGATRQRLDFTIGNTEGYAQLLEALLSIRYGEGQGQETIHTAIHDGMQSLASLEASKEGRRENFILVLSDTEASATPKDQVHAELAKKQGHHLMIIRDIKAHLDQSMSGSRLLWTEKIELITRFFTKYIEARGEAGKKQVETWAHDSEIFLFRLCALKALKPYLTTIEAIETVYYDKAWDNEIKGDNLTASEIDETSNDYCVDGYFGDSNDNLLHTCISDQRISETSFSTFAHSSLAYLPILQEMNSPEAQVAYTSLLIAQEQLRIITPFNGFQGLDIQSILLDTIKPSIDTVLETIRTAPLEINGVPISSTDILFLLKYTEAHMTPEGMDKLVSVILELIDTNNQMALNLLLYFSVKYPEIRDCIAIKQKLLSYAKCETNDIFNRAKVISHLLPQLSPKERQSFYREFILSGQINAFLVLEHDSPASLALEYFFKEPLFDTAFYQRFIENLLENYPDVTRLVVFSVIYYPWLRPLLRLPQIQDNIISYIEDRNQSARDRLDIFDKIFEELPTEEKKRLIEDLTSEEEVIGCLGRYHNNILRAIFNSTLFDNGFRKKVALMIFSKGQFILNLLEKLELEIKKPLILTLLSLDNIPLDFAEYLSARLSENKEEFPLISQAVIADPNITPPIKLPFQVMTAINEERYRDLIDMGMFIRKQRQEFQQKREAERSKDSASLTTESDKDIIAFSNLLFYTDRMLTFGLKCKDLNKKIETFTAILKEGGKRAIYLLESLNSDLVEDYYQNYLMLCKKYLADPGTDPNIFNNVATLFGRASILRWIKWAEGIIANPATSESRKKQLIVILSQVLEGLPKDLSFDGPSTVELSRLRSSLEYGLELRAQNPYKASENRLPHFVVFAASEFLTSIIADKKLPTKLRVFAMIKLMKHNRTFKYMHAKKCFEEIAGDKTDRLSRRARLMLKRIEQELIQIEAEEETTEDRPKTKD